MQKLTWYVLTFLALAAAALMWRVASKTPKIGYCNAELLFRDFRLKKELEKKLLSENEAENRSLDSLEQKIRIQQHALQSLSGSERSNLEVYVNNLLSQYRSAAELTEKNRAGRTAQYDTQIWNQLNTYIEAFGKENGYTAILSKSDGGPVLFVDSDRDITAEVLTYANQQYEGR